MEIEQKILKNLVCRNEYTAKVLPFLKTEYFSSGSDELIFTTIFDYITKYQSTPTYDILKIEIGNKDGLSQSVVDESYTTLNTLEADGSPDDDQWLLDKTEEFCKDRAIYNGITAAIEIMNGKGDVDRGAIPDILSEALGVSFDTNVGHDWLEDWEHRYEFYHTKENKIPFDLEYFNQITKDGVSKKSLNIILAGTGVGKSMLMCHLSASYLLQGKNVLYISMEMSEEKVSERIDANLMNLDIDDVKTLSKDLYEKRIAKIKAKTTGRLLIKEYPTAAASVLNFKALMNELKLKKSFMPDVIMVDYLNICCSSRIKMGSNSNTYTYVKMIAEELRGMAVEFNIPIWSATQVNREGFDNSDPGLENTSESFGLPATADLMFAVITNEELDEAGQVMVKQLKNRYHDLNHKKRGIIGVNKARMKFFDVTTAQQVPVQNVTKSKSASKSASFAPQVSTPPTGKTMSKDKFKGIKV